MIIDLHKNLVHWYTGENIISDFSKNQTEGFFISSLKFLEKHIGIHIDEFIYFLTYN